MESRIVILNSADKITHSNLSVKLLTYLTDKSLLRRLPRLNLTPRKLPPVLEITITALRRENLIPAPYHSSNNLNLFHIKKNLRNPTSYPQQPHGDSKKKSAYYCSQESES